MHLTANSHRTENPANTSRVRARMHGLERRDVKKSTLCTLSLEALARPTFFVVGATVEAAAPGLVGAESHRGKRSACAFYRCR